MRFASLSLLVCFCFSASAFAESGELFDFFAVDPGDSVAEESVFAGEPLLFSQEDPFAFLLEEDDCPGGVCPVPQEAVVVRGQAEPVVSVLHGRVMEQVVPRATVKDYFIVRSESVTYSHADPMRSYSYRYSERPRWRPFQRMRERIRARRSFGLGIFQ